MGSKSTQVPVTVRELIINLGKDKDLCSKWQLEGTGFCPINYQITKVGATEYFVTVWLQGRCKVQGVVRDETPENLTGYRWWVAEVTHIKSTCGMFEDQESIPGSWRA